MKKILGYHLIAGAVWYRRKLIKQFLLVFTMNRRMEDVEKVYSINRLNFSCKYMFIFISICIHYTIEIKIGIRRVPIYIKGAWD